jgi:hypothetical protein
MALQNALVANVDFGRSISLFLLVVFLHLCLEVQPTLFVFLSFFWSCSLCCPVVLLVRSIVLNALIGPKSHLFTFGPGKFAILLLEVGTKG